MKEADRERVYAALSNYRDNGNVEEALRIGQISRATFFRKLKNLRKNGDIDKVREKTGRKQQLTGEYLDWLLAAFAANPGLTLDHAAEQFSKQFGFQPSKSTFSRALQRAGCGLKRSRRPSSSDENPPLSVSPNDRRSHEEAIAHAAASFGVMVDPRTASQAAQAIDDDEAIDKSLRNLDSKDEMPIDDAIYKQGYK